MRGKEGTNIGNNGGGKNKQTNLKPFGETFVN